MIGLSNIVDFNFVFDGPENAALSFTPTAAGTLPFATPFGNLVFVNAPLTAGGNVEIFADGTDFEIRVGSKGPDSTSIFRFAVNACIDFGFGVVPASPVAQFFLQVTTDANGVTGFDRSVFYNDFALDPVAALLVADTGVDSPVPPDGILRLGGRVVDTNGGGIRVVPLPAGAALLLTALGGLALVRRRG